ncbi:MAG: hypothetical protein GQF41_4161 [Candidatus Rifleibacterium amylolyticum]|nr:MAG: hypothetical protein GQF41_4161 [Candidatus Rifleibacterium amylolyticum]
MTAKKFYTTKLGRLGMVLHRRLLLTLFFCVYFAMPICCQNLASNEADYTHANELIKTAGPVPDAVIEPPDQVRYDLTVSERLRRLWLEKVIGFRITYASARGKACHANQRVLAGAIEMYNEDKGKTMKTITHADVTSATGTLIVDRYLKSPITPPDSACEYRSHGDLTGSGIIYCTHHGPIREIQDSIRKELGLKPITAADWQIFVVIGLSLLFLFSIIVLLALFFGRRKKYKDASITTES